jgi:hypothetical protein
MFHMVLQRKDLLKHSPVQCQELSWFDCPNGSTSRGVWEKRQFTKSVARSKWAHFLLVYDQFKTSAYDNIEILPGLSLSKDYLTFVKLQVNHVLYDLILNAARQIRKQEVFCNCLLNKLAFRIFAWALSNLRRYSFLDIVVFANI